MKEKFPKICDASTSEVLHCDNTDCIYNIKHYGTLEDWVIVHPRSVGCKEMEQ